ncbi:MAG: aminotransferase class V-fold PLP-dependent enzyme [Odoribacteraceae bacterium]|jgi:aspartate aminotransferase-like enzyme|nr:aminotransferase class V-fold PLP-dependent enzyme [Odoribacteraceae bacterium]
MEKYTLSMVPGPVAVPPSIREAAMTDYGSGMMEPEYLADYRQTERLLQHLLGTRSRVVIQTGEGMLALWTALKSALAPGDKVLAISTGMFGSGFAEMAAAIGCQVQTLAYPFNETVHDLPRLERAIRDFRPVMITLVHCETPSGTLNPAREIGEIKRRLGVPLLCMDTISGVGGVPVLADDWHVDMALGASQKCLSAPPSLSFLSVSDEAARRVRQVAYSGYEALLPFLDAPETGNFPYTPYWQGLAQLKRACEAIEEEGLEACFERHRSVAAYCRQRLEGMGLQLYPAPGAVNSPTVTAVRVPEIGWQRLDERTRARGLVLGNNFGELGGKVFRLGHMGSQATPRLVADALDILEDALRP